MAGLLISVVDLCRRAAALARNAEANTRRAQHFGERLLIVGDALEALRNKSLDPTISRALVHASRVCSTTRSSFSES